MQSTRAMAYLQQLCCLGVGGEVVIPTVLQALHTVLPSHENAFYWIDAQYNLLNVVEEVPTPELTALYFTEFYRKRDLEVWPGLGEVARQSPDVSLTFRNPRVDRQRFYQSDVYNLCFRPKHWHDRCHAVLREGGRPCGIVSLARRPQEASFTACELALLAKLVPYLRHALQRCPNLTPAWTDSGDVGLIVVDRQGKVLWLSYRARHLLFYAAHPQASPATLARSPGVAVPPEVGQLATRLTRVFAGRDTAPPALSQATPWGQFVYRAFWMEETQPVAAIEPVAPAPSGQAMIGITVQHQVPLPLALMQAMQALPLSTRERAVCLGLAEGLSHTHIALRLGVCAETVVTYVRRIYDKLEVRSHEELLQKLRSQHVSVS